MQTIDIYNRDIILPPELYEISVKYDKNSSKRKFRIKTMQDDVDLSQTTAYFLIENSLNQADKILAPVEISDDYLLLTFTASESACLQSGRLSLSISFEKENYKFQTKKVDFLILDAVELDNQIVNNYPDVLQKMQNQIDELSSKTASPCEDNLLYSFTVSQETNSIEISSINGVPFSDLDIKKVLIFISFAENNNLTADNYCLTFNGVNFGYQPSAITSDYVELLNTLSFKIITIDANFISNCVLATINSYENMCFENTSFAIDQNENLDKFKSLSISRMNPIPIGSKIEIYKVI